MSARLRVLCAEPSNDICSLLQVLLDHNGFDSDSASTISEAVGKAEGGDYCLFIVDDGYRDGTNFELIRRLRALKPHVPVLVYSSISFQESREDAARAGAVSYIVKPGEFGRLVETVVRLCGTLDVRRAGSPAKSRGRLARARPAGTLRDMDPLGLNEGGGRRAHRRYKVSFRVSLMREDSAEVEGVVTDLSAGGCFIESDERVREDDLVKLRFDVPGHGDLTIWGNVIYWIKDTGFGVRFSAFSQGGARDKLALILEEESRRS